MGPTFASSRRRALMASAVTALAVVAALFVALPSAQAAPGPLKPLKLLGMCNSTSWAMATAIDAKLAADGNALRMIQTDQPKAGETGFDDATVNAAMLSLAAQLGKQVGALTDADVANNPAQVAQAIKDALALRAKRDLTLTTSDKTGNAVYLWCLKKNADHGGPDLGLLYVPAGSAQKDGVWIAGCVLAGGMNTYYVSFDKTTGDFTKFVWINQGPDPATPGGFIRYTYVFDVAGNKLTIRKQTGAYNRLGVFVPATTEVEKNPAAPPAQFKDLSLNGVQISLNDGGCACPARTVVQATPDPAAPTTLTFTNPPISGSGTADDPYVGISATIEPGDTIALDMPDGVVPVSDGGDPDWTLLTPGDSTALFQYDGTSELVIPVGDVIGDVAVLGPAPSSSSAAASPSASPSLTGSATSSPVSSPTASPTPPQSPSLMPTTSTPVGTLTP